MRLKTSRRGTTGNTARTADSSMSASHVPFRRYIYSGRVGIRRRVSGIRMVRHDFLLKWPRPLTCRLDEVQRREISSIYLRIIDIDYFRNTVMAAASSLLLQQNQAM